MSLRGYSIVFDGEVFEHPRLMGIWRYAYNTVHRLARQVPMVIWLRARDRMPLPPGATVIRDTGRQTYGRKHIVSRVRRRWAITHPPKAIRRAALYHSALYSTCPFPDVPQVTTVYDMLHERFFHICNSHVHTVLKAKRECILGSQVCICISRATADDLVAFFPEVKDRVRVIHLGFDHLTAESCPSSDEPVKSQQYVLYVGERAQYKNFILVLEAMRVQAWPRNVNLRVVGQPLNEAEVALIASMNLTNVVSYGGRPDDVALREHYRKALCFVFPSLIEGFGIPLLEAQANATPVVCSDIPVFHEVAGEAAHFFDPRLAEDLAEAVTAVQDADTRCRLIQAGRQNIKRFSWDRCAQETLSVYQNIAPPCRRE